MHRASICVFAKPPRPGEAKTRLIGELDEGGAAALAEAFFLDTWAAVSRIDWAQPVLATTDVTAPEWKLPPGMMIWPQGQGDLGHRLERVLRRALETHPIAIAVGTDAPGLPVALLGAARDGLGTSDAVLGPSDDGGFYLLGVRRYPAGLLDGIPWSTSETFVRTQGRLRASGLKTTVLPPWFDVDRPGDLDRLRSLVLSGRISAPETARVLASQVAQVET